MTLNGNPLQCSCLENARDGGAWWAAVYEVAQSRTWLKCLSSSSSSIVQSLSHIRHFATPWTAEHQPSLCFTVSQFAQTHSLSQRCYLIISSSAALFSSCLQPFPALGSFPMSQFFASDGQSIGVSASASVHPGLNIQDWFPLRLTGWISLQSKGLPRTFSNTTVQKYQFLGVQLSLWSNSHIHTWLTLTSQNFVGKKKKLDSQYHSIWKLLSVSTKESCTSLSKVLLHFCVFNVYVRTTLDFQWGEWLLDWIVINDSVTLLLATEFLKTDRFCKK